MCVQRQSCAAVLKLIIPVNWQIPCVFRDLKSQDENIRTAFFYDWYWMKYIGNVGFPGMVDWDVFEPEDDYLVSDWHLTGNASGNMQFLNRVCQ